MKNSKNNNQKSFWVINVSDRNVSLTDLNITIPARSSVDLLSNHYYFTEEQLNNSINSGSLFKKSDKIKKRLIAPVDPNKKSITMDKTNPLIKHTLSIYEIKQEKYDQLEISDEELAEQNADLEKNRT